MPQPRTSDTRNRILSVALDLFLRRGVRATSLRQIAEHLGITKPALYYHFSSRDDLVRTLVQPLIDDVEAVIAEDEENATHDPRTLLGRYFDVSYRHRAITTLLLHDLPALAELGIVDQILAWRRRLITLLVGPEASVAERARAIVALGGLGDCLALLTDVGEQELRTATLDAACDAFGASPGTTEALAQP